MAIWDRFESLILEFLERRVTELLTQGDVAPSPNLIATVREDAVWAATRAVARFQAGNGVNNLRKRAQNH
jgi:hypothetical protein